MLAARQRHSKSSHQCNMAELKLVTYPNNKNAWKALIAAEYVGTKIEVAECQMGKDNKSAEFLELNPNGKVRPRPSAALVPLYMCQVKQPAAGELAVCAFIHFQVWYWQAAAHHVSIVFVCICPVALVSHSCHASRWNSVHQCALMHAQVPTLQTPQGGIWESNAIARYVARLADMGLFGCTLFEAVGRVYQQEQC